MVFFRRKSNKTSFRVDGILEPLADQLNAPRAYVEVQFQADDDFYLRFFSEIFLHLRQYSNRRPWQAIVIYPSISVERLLPDTAPLLELSNLHRVYLDQLPLLESANPKLWLISLIIADKSDITPIVRKVQAHHISKPNDGVDWLDLLETILVYKLPHFTREEIQTMFNYQDITLKETRFYQDVFTEGEAAMLLRLLERKFRPLPEAARQRIATADAETLLLWGERVLDATSLEEIWG
jgi:predicted transposase YdaD